jgi:hypothetical protein
MCTSARWRNGIYNDSDFLARGSLEQYINPPKNEAITRFGDAL